MHPIPSRSAVVQRLKATGMRLAAVLPIHYPRALLRAYKIHPMEVWGPAYVDPIEGDAHFQSYSCGIVRNAASFLLRGDLDAADLLLVPHTCDALQGMASVLTDFVDTKHHIVPLYLPRDTRSSDSAYLEAELRSLGRRLADITGEDPANTDLLDAIAEDEEADSSLAALALQREDVALSDRDYFTLLRAREYLPPQEFVALANAAPRGAPPGADRTPFMLSGIVPEPMTIFDHIEDAGGRVVADDLACCSRRLYPAGTSVDPYRRMAERLIATRPDPTRGTPIEVRIAYLRDRMRDTGARGLLVYDPKFCEPELFDLPLLHKAMNAAGLSMLHVEFDMAATISQQTLTRIEAFVEMLR